MLVKSALSNIVGRKMFDPFEQHNQTCCIVLDGVKRCWMKFDIVQTFLPHHPTFSKIRHNFVPGTEIQHCWMVLDSFEHSSIQHNSTLIKRRPTPSNNIGCLTNMFDPFERSFILTWNSWGAFTSTLMIGSSMRGAALGKAKEMKRY